MTAEMILFWAFAIGSVAGASAVLLFKNPVASAMSLVATFFFLAGVYVLLWAHTIAALQILVYAGAIMVLFLFVIMLLSLQDNGPSMQWGVSRVLGTGSVIALFLVLFHVLRNTAPRDSSWVTNAPRLEQFGTIQKLGEVLYTQWLFPFEAVSLLLLVAIVGAVVVAKSRI